MDKRVTVGIVIASLCLLGALAYHVRFLMQIEDAMGTVSDLTRQLAGTDRPVVPEAGILRSTFATSIALLRLSLISTGVLVGVAFGFLGFSLFVMGITGESDVKAGGAGMQVELGSAAPGLVVIAIAAILIGICVSQSVAVETALSLSK